MTIGIGTGLSGIFYHRISEFQFKRLFGEDKFYNFWRVAAEQFSVKDKQV